MNNEIILGKEEHYDATTENCWSFKKSIDIVNGINLKLGNMCGGFPFNFNGHTWKCSEMLYLCGEFSDTIDKTQIQEDIVSKTSGFASKKFVKNKYTELIREDFNEFRLQWMLFVVWQKCIGNKDFAALLKSIPSDVILIENTTTTTTNNSGSVNIWGCTNRELETFRKSLTKNIEKDVQFKTKKAKEEYINIEINRHNDVGVFIGQNNMGKILMLCRDALKNNTQPLIDYDLLFKYTIYIFGKKVDFNQKTSI